MPTAPARSSWVRRCPRSSAFRISQIGTEPPFSDSALLNARPTAFDVVARRSPSGIPWGGIALIADRQCRARSYTNDSYANVVGSRFIGGGNELARIAGIKFGLARSSLVLVLAARTTVLVRGVLPVVAPLLLARTTWTLGLFVRSLARCSGDPRRALRAGRDHV